MKQKMWGFLAFFAALVAVTGSAFGFSPVDANGVLQLCVEWTQGFTAHMDGIALASVSLAGLRQKRAEKIKEARKLDEKAGDASLEGDDATRFDALMTEIRELDSQIETADKEQRSRERVRQLDADLGKPEPVTTVAGEEVRTDTGGATVGTDRSREAKIAQHTLLMMRAQTQRRSDVVQDHVRELAKLGAYGEEMRAVGEGDAYNTIYDADGAVLLPTTVRDGIDSIVGDFGVARQIADVFNGTLGEIKIPAANGNLKAVAIAEGGQFVAKKRSFSVLPLRPKKWGVLVPWTYEAELALAPRILQDAQQAIAAGFAEAEDDAMFNGNATSAYHNIRGILNLQGISSHTLGAGNVTFASIKTDDALFVRNKIAARLRKQGAYAFHPDMEVVLRTLKDGDGRYIYAYDSDQDRNTLAGRTVHYTEVLPGLETANQANAVFGVFGAFKNWKMAIGQDMTSEELREGSVPDADDQSMINLAANDYRALKVREFFDMGTSFVEAFTLIKTPSTG